MSNKTRQSTIINPRLTRRRVLATAFAWLTAGFLAAAALADDKSAAPAGEPPALVETHHNVTLAGHSFDYRAIAESIALTDGKGEPSASVFTIAYLAEPVAAERRPVAFV